MKKTWMAGSLNTYEVILDALKKKFPTEGELRAHVKELEDAMKASGLASPDYDFLQDSESRDCPGCGRAMSVRETREQGVCDDCAAGTGPEATHRGPTTHRS
jgi:hypothetical protein